MTMGKSKKQREGDKKGGKKGRRGLIYPKANSLKKKRGKTAKNGLVKYSCFLGPADKEEESDGGADSDGDEDN